VNRLYVCGYLDHSFRIFDLDAKQGQHLLRKVEGSQARITCLKFSQDFRYLISCDADGVILHYGQVRKHAPKETKAEAFPYRLLYKIQD